MCLVEDDGIVLGQYTASGGEVREVERVIRDHEIGLARTLARSLGETARDERAPSPRAAVAADGKLSPERIRRFELELSPVAGLGLVEPPLHRLPRPSVTAVGQQSRLEPMQLPAAEVVLATLDDGDGDLAPERGRRERNVVPQQLLL